MMDKKWILLIIMVLILNGVGRLEIIPYEWSTAYMVLSNIVIFGWVIFTLLTSKKEEK